MVGKRFGRLLVLRYSHNNKDKRPMWVCLCDCGAECIVSGKYLRAGRTRSCGCLHREVSSEINKSHSMSGTKTYQSWHAMLTRCYNKKQASYKKYGALVVTVCDRWRDSFENFFADMGERPEGATLDRINPFGNYEPSNCRWSSVDEQANNKRGHAAIAILEMMRAAGHPVDEFEVAYHQSKAA